MKPLILSFTAGALFALLALTTALVGIAVHTDRGIRM